ncbi:MAG: 4-hydroxy-3-methylbut-2-enyl diphosphate reductase [Bacteroidales bacterium]|jgi:4-hydroxy-3-methylbut-2-enyl diphosphate reductase|nr:4-hydroxy-3-methylbut-2-enyl diphosphate reductase [Bacteroidales bacterium]
MKIEIDQKSGFCFGVHNAVEIAEEALLDGEKVYSLGSLMHNDMEMQRLSSLGLITIDHEQFRILKNCKVLIRAHGEPPETYRVALENNITIIEATCPIVRKLQSKIKKTWNEIKDRKGQIVIFGKPGHAEVIGLLGQTDSEGLLVSKASDIDKIDFSRPVALFSQTTMEITEFANIRQLIYDRMKAKGVADPEQDLMVFNTVCGQVSGREPHLRAFAAEHDTIIFVSGKDSSNGRMLYSVCKSINPDTHFISSVEEIEKSWFEGRESVGVCGATSTPRWLIRKVKEYIRNI